jgi:hypothetical protein
MGKTDAGKYTGGTVHEVGHALSASGFQSDYSKSKAGQSNDNLILVARCVC